LRALRLPSNAGKALITHKYTQTNSEEKKIPLSGKVVENLIAISPENTARNFY